MDTRTVSVVTRTSSTSIFIIIHVSWWELPTLIFNIVPFDATRNLGHVYELTCAFNYGFEHCLCIYGGVCRCKIADASGFSILHGRGRTFFATNAVDRTLFTVDIYNEFLEVRYQKKNKRFFKRKKRKLKFFLFTALHCRQK